MWTSRPSCTGPMFVGTSVQPGAARASGVVPCSSGAWFSGTIGSRRRTSGAGSAGPMGGLALRGRPLRRGSVGAPPAGPTDGRRGCRTTGGSPTPSAWVPAGIGPLGARSPPSRTPRGPGAARWLSGANACCRGLGGGASPAPGSWRVGAGAPPGEGPSGGDPAGIGERDGIGAGEAGGVSASAPLLGGVTGGLAVGAGAGLSPVGGPSGGETVPGERSVDSVAAPPPAGGVDALPGVVFPS